MTSVVDIINDDHHAVEELFTKFKNCSSEPDKRHIADRICAELKKHAHAEEAIVYPLLPEEMRHHAQEEHNDIKECIDKITDGVGPIDGHVMALEAVVTHHVQEEEDGMLPWLEESDLNLEEVGEDFEEAKV